MPTAADLMRDNASYNGDLSGIAGGNLGNLIADIFDGQTVVHKKGSAEAEIRDNDLGDKIANYFSDSSTSDGQKIRNVLFGSDAASIGGNQGQLSMVNSAQDINYVNADLAKAYGMDASTAYQEALSNTAYQRAVQDAKNAGLNPALMFTSGSSASSFSGSLPKVSGGSAKAQKGLDVSGIGAALGAVAGLVIGKNPQGMYAGKEVGSAVGSIVEGLVDLSKT